ncbi:MAG TPA: hypothetical protein VIH85_07725, partial [Solirubrobacteraceae bacterium]
MLYAVGAWPWAHFDKGDLPERWWESDVAILPLSIWMNRRIAHRQRTVDSYRYVNDELLQAGASLHADDRLDWEPECTDDLRPSGLAGLTMAEIPERMREVEEQAAARNARNARGYWGAQIAYAARGAERQRL